MPDLPYHAWTHRPKAQGGTDPIEIASGGAITWAKTYGVGNMPDAGTTYPFEWLWLTTNDTAGYEMNDITAGTSFNWIQVNEPGYYIYELRAVHMSTTFDNTDPLFLEGSFLLSGLPASLRVNMDAHPDFSGLMFTKADQLLAGHEEPSGLYTRGTFNYDPDNPASDIDNQATLAISGWIALASSVASLNLEVEMFVMRIADPGYTTTTP